MALERIQNLPTFARMYAAAGHPVFPLVPGRKEPLTGRGFHDATTALVTVEAWWERWPDANIGGRCGVTCDVLDVDVKVTTDGEPVKDGRPAMHRLNAAGVLAGAFGVATTRHGGVHLFYPVSGSTVRHLDRFALDFQAGGSYVVLPPSAVPADEGIDGPGCYAWVDPLDPSRPNTRRLDWATCVRVLQPPTVKAPSAGFETVSGSGSVAGLVRAVRDAAEGSRNRLLFWAACRAVESGHALEDIGRAALDNGLTPSEVRATLASAQRKTKGAK